MLPVRPKATVDSPQSIQIFARMTVRREISEAMNEVVVLMSMHLGSFGYGADFWC
jgi:hypothetical protein